MRRPAALLAAATLLTACLDKTTSIVPPFDLTAPCTFSTRNDTMFVNTPCTTTQTIFVPDGVTLDGQRNTIRVVDPPGGFFTGAVIRTEGATANVHNLIIAAESLANEPHEPPNDLAGIDFVNATGSITDNTVRGIVQYEENGDVSGYQEGFAIRVSLFPATGAVRHVTIARNTVERYQKQGISVFGDGVHLTADILNNTVTGEGPQPLQAQYGIEISGVAGGRVSGNRVSRHVFTGGFPEWAGGIISDSGSNIIFENNVVTASQMGIRLLKNRLSQVNNNEVTADANTPCGTWAPAGTPCSIAIWVHGTDNTLANNRLINANVGVKVGHADNQPPSHGKGPTIGTKVRNNRFTRVREKMVQEGQVVGTEETGSIVEP